MTFGGVSSSFIFLASARTVSSSRDFGVEQFFRADEFRADDPSPMNHDKNISNNLKLSHSGTSFFLKEEQFKKMKEFLKN